MGQNESNQPVHSQSQRIRPTPGTSGRRIRKGAISIYCENSHSIYTFNTTPGMTIGEVKSLLPTKNCELRISEHPLTNSTSLESLALDSKTLLRMVVEGKISQKSSSTADSLQAQDLPRIIGPKKQFQEKPEKPNHESISSNIEDFPLPINLKIFAVPDLKIEKTKKKSKKSLY
ncbi:hypothetical protein SteCoe_18105 [Stentor coeruleus]|uniref:Ubiquitin-like domain-containing protein n=1 Tax=Stentor coeruleus TaxID=5963 RepID=A0A1R2BXB8_9CILI|nr:hypothetical protein SteCoe_18105 [Stentor coeruleus]